MTKVSQISKKSIESDGKKKTGLVYSINFPSLKAACCLASEIFDDAGFEPKRFISPDGMVVFYNSVLAWRYCFANESNGFDIKKLDPDIQAFDGFYPQSEEDYISRVNIGSLPAISGNGQWVMEYCIGTDSVTDAVNLSLELLDSHQIEPSSIFLPDSRSFSYNWVLVRQFAVKGRISESEFIEKSLSDVNSLTHE